MDLSSALQTIELSEYGSISSMELWIALDIILQGLIDLDFFNCIDSKFLVNRNVWSLLVMCLPFDALSYKHDIIFIF